ncbi:MAG TPA: isochorismatase family protein [Thermoplasmata archaeon]|nr:isochorismatase family protein [Thermoplasmata archaeon]
MRPHANPRPGGPGVPDGGEGAGRRQILVTALRTEPCLTFPTLDMLREGYEVHPIVDAVGGTLVEAHRSALERVEQAGAHLIRWVQLACELRGDRNRADTAKEATRPRISESSAGQRPQLSRDFPPSRRMA